MRQWRLIDDSPTTGARNMALDEAILRRVGASQMSPTLRLYAWSPPCLSLGYGQRAADVDFARAEAFGWDVVRRPTGGRAILHTDELTYSLALPAGHELAAGNIVDSYRRISAALVAGLQKLGADPQAERHEGQLDTIGAVCFETPSHYEITVNGRKLVGSAQVRRYGGVLQHGSIPLYGDLGRICDVLAYQDETEREAAKVQLYARALTLADALDRYITWDEAAGAVITGFAETFGVHFVAGELTQAEWVEADRLEHEVYGTEAWTRRR
jgi:lipoate-protein ligase A